MVPETSQAQPRHSLAEAAQVVRNKLEVHMKLIIAGGRNYHLTVRDLRHLDELHGEHKFTEVVTGGARGADTGGINWAQHRKIPFRVFPADWDNIDVPGAVVRYHPDGRPYNAAAGAARNEKMAEYADACVLFPGHRGTNDMAVRARAHGLVIFDWR